MADVYDLYRRGLWLLASGNTHAAATVLEQAVSEEPEKGSLRESLARAYYASRRYGAALEQFTEALEIDPVNDYAHFGAGLCLGRLGRVEEALGHLKIAAVMRPQVDDYTSAVRRWEARHRTLDGRPRPTDETR